MCDPVYVLLPEKNTPQDQVYVISRHEFVIFFVHVLLCSTMGSFEMNCILIFN